MFRKGNIDNYSDDELDKIDMSRIGACNKYLKNSVFLYM